MIARAVDADHDGGLYYLARSIRTLAGLKLTEVIVQ